MKPELLQEIINAVLYEGYVLYPYRSSSKKNSRERFTFGRVYPEAFSNAIDGAEPWVMQTECLVRLITDSSSVKVSVGFLQPISREIAAFPNPVPECADLPMHNLRVVPELRVGDRLFQSWHIAAERKIDVPALAFSNGSPTEMTIPFRFAESHDAEPIPDAENMVRGMIFHRQESIGGLIQINLEALSFRLVKVTVRILNQSPLGPDELENREVVLSRTFSSTHTILSVVGGEFISLMDPPDEYKSATDDCKNIGAWPVLVGDEQQAERDTMLSSPIILYDYPKIASDSAGPLFDSTEIDEILTLRILTLTDAEKLEMGCVDEQARRLLERTESLSEDALLRMHGTMRQPKVPPIEFDDFFGASTPLKGVSIGNVYLQKGDRVRLRPKKRADVIDLALNGQTAVIEAVEQDLEKRIHLSVVLENDPGRDLGLLRQPGHRFFYGVDEVEPLTEEVL